MILASLEYPSVQATGQENIHLRNLHMIHSLLESSAYPQIIDDADPTETHVDLPGPSTHIVSKAITVVMKQIQRSHDAHRDPTRKHSTPAWHPYYTSSDAATNRARQRGAVLRLLRFMKREFFRAQRDDHPTYLGKAIWAAFEEKMRSFPQRHPEYNRARIQSMPEETSHDNTVEATPIKVEEDRLRKSSRQNELKPKTIINLEDDDDEGDEEPLWHKPIKTESSNQAAQSKTRQTTSRKKVKTQPVEQESVVATTQLLHSNNLIKVEADHHALTPAPTVETQSTPTASTNMITASAKEKEKARIKLQLESIELEQESVGLKRKSVGLRQQLMQLEDEDE